SAAALLEHLGPWLTNARKALLESPPFADPEDVAQQLVLEVLEAAATWEQHCEDRWIPRRLVEAAERRVHQALIRERHHATLELDDRTPAPDGSKPRLLLDTPIGLATADDLRVIYRRTVLGQPIEDLAREAGVTPRQMRRRVQLAKRRARA
ncbi:MAG TPA: hypothetical protein VNA65_11255, partial [Candidatus Dormibacteraeota bacterium]|nr:hypothetical protein [Candidatus Dormibacteraeota bacterium]